MKYSLQLFNRTQDSPLYGDHSNSFERWSKQIVCTGLITSHDLKLSRSTELLFTSTLVTVGIIEKERPFFSFFNMSNRRKLQGTN